MDKRRFLAAGMLGAVLPLEGRADAARARRGTGLLTVGGAIGRSNRGPFDPALDQLMAKHGGSFVKGWELDAAMLERLPALTIRPTL